VNLYIPLFHVDKCKGVQDKAIPSYNHQEQVPTSLFKGSNARKFNLDPRVKGSNALKLHVQNAK